MTAGPQTITEEDVKRYCTNYIVEKDGIALYRAMAEAESDPKRAEIFEKLAQNEERHAQRWARLIESAGAQVPSHHRSARVLLLGWLARRFGTKQAAEAQSTQRRSFRFLEIPETLRSQRLGGESSEFMVA